jgi:cobalt-zinc-cadmium efflux system outer membrane protein
MDAELKAGNVALKDNMRLKALLFNLQNELVNIQSAMMPLQSELKLLLQSADTSFIAPQLTYKFGELTTVSIPAADSLLQTALQNRPDAKMAHTSLDFQNHNLVYQKALAKPDISVGTEFDQRNSYNPNYFGLAVSVPLNIFNKNQGNIKAAQFSIKQQQTQLDFANDKIKNEVTAVIGKFKYYQEVNNLQQLDFSKKYDDLFFNMLKSYQARQISLLELIDFIDAYKDTKLKLVEQHNSLIKSIEDINYTTNSTVIPVQ